MEPETACEGSDGVQVAVEFEVLDQHRTAERGGQLRPGRSSGDQVVRACRVPSPITDRKLDRLLASDQRTRGRIAGPEFGHHLTQFSQIGDQLGVVWWA